MASEARLVGIGVFVLAGLALFTLGLFMIGDRQMAFARKFIVYTEFKKITGLAPGSIVRVSGAKAGAIKSILTPNTPSGRFRVEIEITEELHPLVRTNSLATIETEGLVGGSYLGVGTGSDTAAEAPPKSTIPSKEPFEVADLMQQMGDTIKNVNNTIDQMNYDVQRAVVSIADTAEDANGLIKEISGDVKKMAVSGARISDDARQIADGVRAGKGTIGKLVNDDELYTRMAAIARQADEIATNTKQVIEQARNTLEGLQSKDGPVQGVTADLKQTMVEARNAMAGFAENMEAMKHNFLLRGFFNDRGFFNLSDISPDAYRRGALTRRGDRRAVRVWLGAPVLFEADSERPDRERLSEGGKARLDSSVATFIDSLPGDALIVEGYARQGTKDEQYLHSRIRASLVRDYLINKFELDPQLTAVMPLGADGDDGVALAVFREKGADNKKP
jgi:phospholipid/cholesterol/gamma-HCH transport system substrate-binding protein